MNYWTGKKKRQTEAIYHTKLMEERFSNCIANSVKKSVIYGEKYNFKEVYHTNTETSIILLQTDSVDAIRQLKETDKIKDTGISTNITVLNFASYKHPGGMYMQGSSAQEECLCAKSFLYNVLSSGELKPFYTWNQAHLNYALYLNRAIMSPYIYFEGIGYCNVLTCAAPNCTAAYRYTNINEKDNYDALYSRIRFVLQCCAEYNSDILILGAYGCGVFGQDSQTVAASFKQLLDGEFKNTFKTVAFAVPDEKNFAPF